MTSLPVTRIQRRRRSTRVFLLGCVIGITAGWLCYQVLHRITKAPAPWFAEFPEDGDKVESWRVHDTQRLWESRTEEVWKHYRRWFVVCREPRANGRRLGAEEWYFIDPTAKRMVGPWQPGVHFPRHGFMPDGRYVGLRTNPTQGTFRMLMFDPETGETEVKDFDGRSGGVAKVWRRICLSADCSTLAVVEVQKEQELWVRFFDVASGRTITERTFEYTGYPSGGYFRQSPRTNEGPPILYTLSPDGSHFVVADTSQFQVVTTKDGQTVASGSAWDPDDPRWKSPPRMYGLEFTPDGQSVVLAFCRFRHPTTETRRTFSLQENEFVGEEKQRLGYMAFSQTGAPHARFLLVGKHGVRLRDRLDYLQDNQQTVSVKEPTTFPRDQRSSFAVGTGRPKVLRVKHGQDAMAIRGVPDSNMVVVNLLSRTAPRKARVPFMRSVMNFLKVDQPVPSRLVEGIWHYDTSQKEWQLIRQLTRKDARRSTLVSVQPGRIGLMMRKNGRYRYEVWPLPRYEAKWLSQVATSVGFGAFFATLVAAIWRSRRRKAGRSVVDTSTNEPVQSENSP